ncbi:MAG: ABC transporter ATP-binding protein [Thiocapsa sp. C3-sup]
MQFLVILMALAEIISVLSVGPFMALVSDPDLISSNTLFSEAYRLSGAQSASAFLVVAGIGVLAVLAISTAIATVTIWRLSIFGTMLGTELSDRLYTYYLNRDWLFHSQGSTASLTKQIASEAPRITNGIIQPLLQISARFLVTAFILAGILAYRPAVALVVMLTFLAFYLIVYQSLKRRLEFNGQRVSMISALRFKLINEGFGGIKEILVAGRQRDFVLRFQSSGKALAQAQGENTALIQLPRHLLELVAFGSVIALVLYFVSFKQDGVTSILPVLAVFGLAGVKLLPAFQQIYGSLALIRGNTSALEAIGEDLRHSKDLEDAIRHLELPSGSASTNRATLRSGLSLQDVWFRYPGKPEAVLRGLSMDIPANRVIGIVGPSGSGKSTTVDLLLGLIEPDQGNVIIDGEPLSKSNVRQWQDRIGFVPQAIFLTDGSLLENIAFGLPPEQQDLSRVKQAVRLAELEEFVCSLPDGLQTRVGERGVQLSGGQRQRIGIARALCDDAQVLLLDEATSSLDGVTERRIMDGIFCFSRSRTIIMIAHRLKTVERCDLIFYLDHGQVTDRGTFAELVARNDGFRRMAQHA